MSVCLHRSLRPTFSMDAAGFEPLWGVQVGDEKTFATRRPRNQFGMKIMRAESSPPSKLTFVICIYIYVISKYT